MNQCSNAQSQPTGHAEADEGLGMVHDGLDIRLVDGQTFNEEVQEVVGCGQTDVPVESLQDHHLPVLWISMSSNYR